MAWLSPRTRSGHVEVRHHLNRYQQPDRRLKVVRFPDHGLADPVCGNDSFRDRCHQPGSAESERGQGNTAIERLHLFVHVAPTNLPSHVDFARITEIGGEIKQHIAIVMGKTIDHVYWQFIPENNLGATVDRAADQ
jgi:hypothetical protein